MFKSDTTEKRLANNSCALERQLPAVARPEVVVAISVGRPDRHRPSGAC
jgi:hypothetical protein